MKYIRIAIVALLVLLASATVFLSMKYFAHTKEIKRLTAENSSLTFEITAKKIVISNLENSNQKEKEFSSTVRVISQALASSIDKLDDLILADDSRNVEIVKFFVDNAQFDVQSGLLAEAKMRSRAWDNAQKQSNNTYDAIKAELNVIAKKITEVFSERNQDALPNTES